MSLRVPRLKGRVALIAGGTDDLGEEVVREFLERGAIAVVPSPSAERLERLRDRLQDNTPTEDLVTIFGDVGHPHDAERIREVLLGRVGRLDAVVTSLGRLCDGQSLVEVSLESWQCGVRDHLTNQCVLVHTFMPLMIAQGYGSYTLIKRTATEVAGVQAGPDAVVGAAQDMLVRNLLEELAGTHVRINQVIVSPDTSARKGARESSEGLIGDCVRTFTAWLASEEAASVRGATIRLVER